MPSSRKRLLVLNDPHPMRVSGDLAKEIGFNESIVFLQMEYLISISDHEHDGRVWTYQSLREMCDQYFPWWSIATLSRTIRSLEEQNLIVIGNFNRAGYDRTQWFALNEEGIKNLASVAILQNETPMDRHFAKRNMDTDKMKNGRFKLQNPYRQNETTIPETTTETTTEIVSATADAADATPAADATDIQRLPATGKGRKKPALIDTLPETAQAACKQYQAIFGRYPNTVQMEHIAQYVTDLDRWSAVLAEWQLHGWNKTNVGGMVARYQKQQDEAPADDLIPIASWVPLIKEQKRRFDVTDVTYKRLAALQRKSHITHADADFLESLHREVARVR